MMENVLKNIILLVLAGSTAFSCANGDKKQEASTSGQTTTASSELHDEVMAIHDEVMPKMDDIMRLKDLIHKKIDSATQNNSAKKAELEPLENAINDLEKADEAMMEWMRNFQPQKNAADQEKAIEYYEQQKEKIEKVKQQMLKAINNAQHMVEGKD